MRVSQKLMTDMATANLLQRTQDLYKTHNRISSGKRINRPSDDPIGMNKVLDYRQTLCAIEQYQRNIGRGMDQLRLTDNTLGELDNLLIRAKELAVYQATETSTEHSRKIAAQEVEQIRGQMLKLANTRLGADYIFAGHKTQEAPFTDIDGTYRDPVNQTAGDIEVSIGRDVTLKVNVNGKDVFKEPQDIFSIMKNLQEGLENNNTEDIAEQIDKLTASLEQVTGIRGEVGARINRLEFTNNYHSDFALRIKDMLVDTEDLDMIEAIALLTTQEAAYQSSLTASARILQMPRLIMFI